MAMEMVEAKMATLSVVKKGVIIALVRGRLWKTKWAKNQTMDENAEKKSIDAIEARKLHKNWTRVSDAERVIDSPLITAATKVPIRKAAAENKER